MKITEITMKKAEFAFNKPFEIAFAVLYGFETMVLRIDTDEGISGYGEAGPLEYVTGDNLDTCMVIAGEFRKKLIGTDPTAIQNVHQIMDSMYHGHTAVKAAFDIACHDIAAKKMGVPLYRYLGGSDPHLESDVTIGIGSPEAMAEDCLEWKNKGFNILKIKLGHDIVSDGERIKAVRKAVGEDVTLRVDANQGWSLKDTLQIEPLLRELKIELIEQPLRDFDFEGMKEIKMRSLLPIIADESCHLPTDALRLASMRACDGMNIKLMKCGGIEPALRINAIAEAADMFCMLGCMGESVIANTAAMHAAAARRNISKIDLDITFFSHCDWITGGFVSEGGKITLSDEPGIGIKVNGF
jgi:L-alanine-DL-glutamate epimerase-like enolase superfamily enzyme